MNSEQAEQGRSLLARVQDWFRSLPLVTKTLLCTCVVATTFGSIGEGQAQQRFCLSAYETVWGFQIYRLLTSIWIHAGVLHLGLNMLALVPIAKSLENQLGSIFMMYLILIISGIANFIYILSNILLERYVPKLGGCVLGISGVIFGLIVIETRISGVQQRSIFGLFTLPAAYYPLALLVFLQLIFPHVSFMGHLGGLLAGQLLIMGWLNRIVPNSNRLQALENQQPFRNISLWNSFVQNTSNGPIFPSEPVLPINGSLTGRTHLQAQWDALISRVRSLWRRSNGANGTSGSFDNLGTSRTTASDSDSADPKLKAAKAAEARFAKFQAESGEK